MSLLTLINVSKIYADGKKTLNDVSFNINRGEIVGLLGKNGAGKTTLVKILLQVLSKTSGEIFFKGRPLKNDDCHYRQNIGVVHQRNAFDSNLSAMDNLIIYSHLLNLNIKNTRDKIIYFLELFEIKDISRKRVATLSGGECRKLQIIRAILHTPELLILDEPTVGLDIGSRLNFWSFIKSFSKINGASVLVSSHYLEEIKENCDRVLFLDSGHLKEIEFNENKLEEAFLGPKNHESNNNKRILFNFQR